MSRTPEHHAECLYRIAEFRSWVKTNALFPDVPDNLVKLGVDALRAWEYALVGTLYAEGRTDLVVAIEKQLQPAPRAPVS